MRWLRPRHFVTLALAMQSFDQPDANLKRPARMGQLITIGRTDDLPEGRGATVELNDGAQLALFHAGGEFYAVSNFCPHRGAPLADGNLCDAAIECDWHGWRFDLKTGACLTRASDALETYEVIIEDGWIKIRV